jgi:hypothetical protein
MPSAEVGAVTRKNVARNLHPVFAVILPRTTGLNVFAGGDGWRRAQHRDQITMTTSFDTKNAKAAVRTMESDAFDQTG